VLTVSDEAKEYILIEKKAVYLLQTGRTSLCCGNIDFGPSVFLGNPPDDNDYNVKEINGITVYLPQNFCTNVPLTIQVGKFLGIKTLYIEGWKLI
jgi:hypothetical protein